jgi:hypothetical protein
VELSSRSVACALLAGTSRAHRRRGTAARATAAPHAPPAPPGTRSAAAAALHSHAAFCESARVRSHAASAQLRTAAPPLLRRSCCAAAPRRTHGGRAGRAKATAPRAKKLVLAARPAFNCTGKNCPRPFKPADR